MARAFNLTAEELTDRFLTPLVNGRGLIYNDREWTPRKTTVTIYEGPELPVEQMGMGRGWGNVQRGGTDVTERILRQARGQKARHPALDRLQARLAGRLSAGPVTARRGPRAGGRPDARFARQRAVGRRRARGLGVAGTRGRAGLLADGVGHRGPSVGRRCCCDPRGLAGGRTFASRRRLEPAQRCKAALQDTASLISRGTVLGPRRTGTPASAAALCDVVNVVVELRDQQERLVGVELVLEPGDVGRRPARPARGSRRGWRGPGRRGRRAEGRGQLTLEVRRRPPTARRVVMKAVDDDARERQAPFPQGVRRNQIASVDRFSLGRGDEHERRLPRVQQLLHVLGTSVKFSVISPSSAKKPVTSAIASKPVTRRSADGAAAPCRRSAPASRSPVGRSTSFSIRPSRNAVSRRGASRKSSALREGGVSRTTRSNSALVGASS